MYALDLFNIPHVKISQQFQKEPLKIKGSGTLLRITGLEPARRRHQNLNLARLPIPPYPQITYCFKKITKVFTLAILNSEASGIRTPDNLIKSQVLYRLS